jgi:hypothetical protein
MAQASYQPGLVGGELERHTPINGANAEAVM